jgi:hypothetical protein
MNTDKATRWLLNPLWGASRIHGELLKLGINISQTAVATHMRRRQPPPSHTWRTFLANQRESRVNALHFERSKPTSVISGCDREMDSQYSRTAICVSTRVLGRRRQIVRWLPPGAIEAVRGGPPACAVHRLDRLVWRT